MSRLRLGALALLTAFAVPAAVATADEPKAPASPADVRAYQDSGEWAKDTKAAFATAKKDIQKALAKKGKKGKPTLVLDIDDTTLSTYACADPGDFTNDAINRCIVDAKLPAIKAAKTLAGYAQSVNVKVVFITARPEGLRALTVANLQRIGISGQKYTLIMKPNDSTGQSSAAYKAAARKTLVKQGARILVTVGDQKSDLSGGAAEYTVKIPNPMYVNA